MICGGLAGHSAQADESVPPPSPHVGGIMVNQAGYMNGLPKTALLLNSDDAPVLLRHADTNKVAELIVPAPPRIVDGMSIREVSFGALRTHGRYRLTQGALHSPAFEIGPWPYAGVSNLLMRAYYLQRCGVAIHDQKTGLKHAACHLGDGVIAHADAINAKGAPWPAMGGWHDAGDYGKYIAPAAVTVARLLDIYERRPDRYPDGQLDIPESGNGKPDLLDEVRYELDWMLRMQRQDGAVYRKLSGARWPEEAGPERDHQPRLVYGISSPETGKFAAVMAQAARVYRKTDRDLSERCLMAARKAWHWLEQNPDMRVDHRPGDDAGSGGYMASDIDGEAALHTDRDDRLAAAGELFVTTGEIPFLEVVQALAPSSPYTLFEWKDHSALVLWTLLQHPDKRLDELRPIIKSRLLERASAILQRVHNHPFRLANTRFIWGSNKMTAEEGITLLHAYTLTGDKVYRDAAADQVHYLLGRNAFGISFVSGVGERPVRRVNHILSRNTGMYIPGLLVGGPNDSAQDGVAPKGLGMLSYLDHDHSYATNEFAIDYNAALIGLIELLGSTLNGD
ncbi:MAG: glycosyl hydrolase family 5 [Halothiobacillaceae bacterium]|nr:MAG: glycosyl hydrolase family 5 [Halothiobacillaceae bacterium]